MINPVPIRLGGQKMQYLIFDIDGSLIQSQQFDTEFILTGLGL